MAEQLATVTQVKDLGMIQIRADLGAEGAVIAAAAGVALPATGRIATAGARALGWMSPDELLLLVPVAEVQATIAALETALQGKHALVVDVSDMRAVFDLIGSQASEVLAKLSPVDFDALPEDGLRRTRLAQIACGIWPIGNGYRVIGFRSVADYMRELLTTGAKPGTSLAPR